MFLDLANNQLKNLSKRQIWNVPNNDEPNSTINIGSVAEWLRRSVFESYGVN